MYNSIIKKTPECYKNYGTFIKGQYKDLVKIFGMNKKIKIGSNIKNWRC